MVELARWRFEAQLLQALAEIDVRSFSIDVPDETDEKGAFPYVQFAGGGQTVRAEVSSNQVPDPAYLMTADQEAALEALGWSPPTEGHGPNWWCSVPDDETEVLLPMVTAALRQVFDIVHPEFLLSDELWPVQEDPSVVEGSDEPHWETTHTVHHPDSHEELVAMVAETLGGASGAAGQDSDGEFALNPGTVPFWVRVRTDRPMVSVFSFLVTSVHDVRQARVQVALLNKRQDHLKFVLDRGTITAKVDLLAVPFVPQLLRNPLTLVSEQLDDIAADTAVRVRGKLWLDDREPAHRHTEDDPT